MVMECKVTASKSHYPKDVPFEVPEGWVWCRLEDIAYVAAGNTPDKSCFVPEGIPYIKMYNVRNQQIDFDYSPQYIIPSVHYGKLQRSILYPGDLLMNIVGPPLGKLAIIPDSLPESNTNQAAVLIRPFLYKGLINKYLFYYLEEMTEINSIATKGSAGQVNISLTQSQLMRIPLPPLEEQRKIVESIEKWIGLVDNIANGVKSILDNIENAKAKILELAIHGKLIPQDSSDEPAIELLRRINPAFKPSDNLHYEGLLPYGWLLCSLGDISNYGQCISVSVDDIGEEDWVLELEDIEKDSGRVLRKLTKTDRRISGIRHRFRKGQVLYSKLRTYLNKVLVADEDGFCTTEIIPITPIDGIDPFYLSLVLRSPYFLNYTASCGYGVKMPRLGTNDARKAIIPVPPDKEQCRIVKQTKELLSELERIAALDTIQLTE